MRTQIRQLSTKKVPCRAPFSVHKIQYLIFVTIRPYYFILLFMLPIFYCSQCFSFTWLLFLIQQLVFIVTTSVLVDDD